MIVEPGIVVGVDRHDVLVETAGRAGCARCEAGAGCGNVLMGRLLGDRLHVVRAADGGFDDLGPGDRVSLGLRESALVRGAAIAYLLPLAGLFVGMLTALWLLGPVDAYTIAGAASGLIGGVAAARVIARRAGRGAAFRPVVVGCERAP